MCARVCVCTHVFERKRDMNKALSGDAILYVERNPLYECLLLCCTLYVYGGDYVFLLILINPV